MFCEFKFVKRRSCKKTNDKTLDNPDECVFNTETKKCLTRSKKTTTKTVNTRKKKTDETKKTKKHANMSSARQK